MTKLFQSPCLPKEMVRSIDVSYRLGDNRIPVDGTLQYRWSTNMATLKPEANRPVVTPVRGVNDHPHSEDSSPFYMTGGTKRSHVKE